jgi:hypothetical protein
MRNRNIWEKGTVLRDKPAWAKMHARANLPVVRAD